MSIPFVAASLLIALLEMHWGFTLLLVALICLCWQDFLRRYVLFRHPRAVFSLETDNTEFFITDMAGQRYQVKPLSGAILHPRFSLFSVACETNGQTQTGWRAWLPGQTRRHILICRYNANSMQAFRRLRVALKFLSY